MDLFILFSRYIINFLAILIFVLNLGQEQLKPYIVKSHLYKIAIALFTFPMIIIMIKDFENISYLFINWFLMIIIISVFYYVLKGHLEIMGAVILYLIIISMIMLNRLNIFLARRQIIFLTVAVLAGLAIVVLFSFIINKKLMKFYTPILLILLLLPFILGERIYGALNWVDLEIISFQPSELGKILYVLIGARILTNNEINKPVLKFFILTSIISSIFLVQRDLGAAFLYFGVFLILFYIHTLKLLYLIIGGVLCGVGGLIFTAMFAHVRQRVLNWINPFNDVLGSGYQMVQGLFAMGTWGVLGSGIYLGTPKNVPFVTTDFIFAAIVEELGIIIAFLVILSFFCIGFFGCIIAIKLENDFLKYIALGYTSFIILQSFLILGGILQIIPLTGVTLPFVSYGGSSILSSIIMIFILFYLPYYNDEGTKKNGRKK
ncbi:hypothetical protein AN641_00185 [Candidatus Epulonipiscioides gigas]|nr:hypothetical protein AN641_00185 [Epulopiscium sp. SCG-C07WGA-EpuloA2]